jgi:DNA polymerase V
MSNRVMTTIEEMSPRCEIYSIDEIFCDLTGVRHCRDLTEFGREIRATVLQRTHLTVGVGIAQTKTLAKLANHAAKNGNGRPEGWSICQILSVRGGSWRHYVSVTSGA